MEKQAREQAGVEGQVSQGGDDGLGGFTTRATRSRADPFYMRVLPNRSYDISA